MMLKAILFDVDDTLIDWGNFTLGWENIEAYHLQSVFNHLVECSPQRLPDFQVYSEEYLRRQRDAWMSARGNLQAPHLGRLLVDTAVAIGVPVDTVDMQRCLDAYAWQVVRDTTLFPEVIEILTLLRDRGLQMGIVTNSFHPMSLRDLELKAFGIFDFFSESRITAADVGYLKPHPAIFEAALAKLGVSADEAVFVGDNPVADIAGAQGAGMRAVLRRKAGRLPATSGLVVPDAAIASLTELPAILDQWFGVA